MATPIVSSAIGLVKAIKPVLTSDQILEKIQETATPVNGDTIGLLNVCRLVANVLEKDDSLCDGS